MRRAALAAVVWLVTGGLARAGGDLLIQHARLVDGTDDAPRADVSIRIENGRITAIGSDLAADGVPLLDVRGATVLPGLIDAHVHASFVPGGDVRGDSAAERRRLVVQHLRAYVACGVTTILDAGIGTEDALEIERWLAAGNPGPRFLTLGPGFFTPGGFLSPPVPGVANAADVERVFRDVVAAHAVGAGIMLEHGWMGVPPLPLHGAEVRAAIVRGARARNLPLYFHATSEDDQALALDMGAYALLQSVQYRREALSAEFVARMARSGAYQMTSLAAADGIVRASRGGADDPLVRLVVPPAELATAHDPAVAQMLARDMAGRIAPWLPSFLRGSVARAIMSDTSARFSLAGSQRALRRLHDAGVPIVVGSEVGGSLYDLHGPGTLREVELLGAAGLTPREAIAAATRVPARMLGLDGEIGTVAVGKRADLLIVRDDPLLDLRALRSVRYTVRDGVAHTPPEWMGVDAVYDPPPPAPEEEASSTTTLGVNPSAVAGAYAVVALLWALLAVQAWRISRRGTRRGAAAWMPPLVCGLTSVHYAIPILMALTADALITMSPMWLEAGERLESLTFLAAMPIFRHLLHAASMRTPRPTRRWLAVNYLTPTFAAVLLLFPRLVPAPTTEMRALVAYVVHVVYLLVVGFLILREVRRFARPGVWRPGGLGDARSADIVLLFAGLAAGVVAIFLAVTGGAVSVWSIVLNLAVGVVLGAPFAVRALGEVVRGFLLVTTAVAATAAVFFGVPAVSPWVSHPAFRRAIAVTAVVGLAVLFVGGQPVLRQWIDRLVFRRTRRRQAELRQFLQGLAPELGTADCCRRAIVEVVRVMHFRGAAIVLRDGETFVGGDIALGPVERVWPHGDAADVLPPTPLTGWYELRSLPPALGDALAEADVVGVVPIATPRRRWGHLLVSAGFLAADFAEEDVQATCAFADQLALVIAGAELLSRTIAAERLLAHREKLAAIGELAARVAHEIRNPVTAARSLAQQLARDLATAPDAEAATLILAELERVERQVATLLRFSRRDEFHFAPVDLGALTRATVDALRPRLDAAGIGVEVVTADVTAHADAEKIRQVLLNLVENAIDALADATQAPRLSVVVGRENGSAAVRVTDNGPGLSADAVPHLFEPFFSRKANGTGLGLAIAKRTVDAHGGRIDASSPSEGGTTFAVVLPLA